MLISTSEYLNSFIVSFKFKNIQTKKKRSSHRKNGARQSELVHLKISHAKRIHVNNDKIVSRVVQLLARSIHGFIIFNTSINRLIDSKTCFGIKKKALHYIIKLPEMLKLLRLFRPR